MFKVPSIPMVLALIAAIVLGVLLGWIVSALGHVRHVRGRRGVWRRVTVPERATEALADRTPMGPRQAYTV